MDAQVVQQHHGYSPALLGVFDGAPQLGAKRLRLPARCAFPIEPTIPPVDQAKAVFLLVVARCLDQSLPTTAFLAPDTRQGGMQRDLDFVLQIHVGARQQAQQPGQILGQLITQQWIGQQILDRWRHWRRRGR